MRVSPPGSWLPPFVSSCRLGGVWNTAQRAAIHEILRTPPQGQSRSGARTKAAAGVLFFVMLSVAWGYDAQLRSAGFVDTDTAYNRVIVFKGAENSTGRLMRVMVTGPHAKQSAMYLDAPSALALPYTRYFRLVEHFVPQMRRLLVLGSGGFSFPKKTTSLDHKMESCATNRF